MSDWAAWALRAAACAAAEAAKAALDDREPWQWALHRAEQAEGFASDAGHYAAVAKGMP